MSLELLRVEFRVVALVRNDDGIPAGEQPLAEGAVYPAALDEFPAEVRGIIKNAGEQ
jgi:hypothetical protein